MRKLTTERALFDFRVRSLPQKYQHSPSDSPDVEGGTFTDPLRWAIDLILNLEEHLDHSQSHSPDQNDSQPDPSPNMKRGQPHFGQPEDHSSAGRQYLTTAQHGYSVFTHSGTTSEQGQGHPYNAEPMMSSLHRTASSSESAFMSPQSPLHAPQPSRPGMLPSPSSTNFPNPPPNLPPISPSSAAVQDSAQTSHLQNLQHQISVKTLALQTLQREYDNLLQKLERQRTKCATIEKELQVSDMEINSLTNEKEKLQVQVMALETQVEELQHSRDETRRQLVANGAQYIRIMEMANRLQTQSSEDKKLWDAEKAELQQRINVLEEAMVTGTAQRDSPPSIILAHSMGKNRTITSTSSPSTETLNVLRSEIVRLRLRTQTLESALHTMREESTTIQKAAKQLLESGNRMEQITKEALSE
ncbi:hypothetical protein P280DRAFT_515713 [Massarina eburnea CBS 473.64]|uniref:Uncharacterized protein n=1 Tax=Massarina eburnea CBS 473.64 TaxID=1395130 RepID=A0A6A6S7U5_9PLEO|nr:hypothetical protein P280DRAFT_515713 [Massarina eburnea CBS 473.64]